MAVHTSYSKRRGWKFAVWLIPSFFHEVQNSFRLKVSDIKVYTLFRPSRVDSLVFAAKTWGRLRTMLPSRVEWISRVSVRSVLENVQSGMLAWEYFGMNRFWSLDMLKIFLVQLRAMYCAARQAATRTLIGSCLCNSMAQGKVVGWISCG